MKEDKPLITIITVVYNGAKYLECTIQSIINQTYSNIEYIIIDGGSTDGTLDLIKKYEDQVDYWISEKDDGIYDAMNKGIELTNGEWINFMNAGDSFADENVLTNFSNQLTGGEEIIYGDVIVKYDNKHSKHIKPNNLSLFYKGIPFCHQSSFISSNLMKTEKYNLTYTICADFDFFYKAYNSGKNFRYINQTIALYDYNGISTDSQLAHDEQKKIVTSYSEKYIFYYTYTHYKKFLRKLVKKMLPLNIIRKIQMAKNGKQISK